MADVTGGTPPTNASPFAVPADIKEVYDHFGDPAMFEVASVGSLPASGNWPSRLLGVASPESLYRWNGSGWDRLWLDDTGWQTISLASGWTAQTPDVAEYRVFNGYCSLSGRLDATGAASQTPFTLPVGARPSRAVNIHMQATTGPSGDSFVVVVATSGVVTVFKGALVVNDLPLTAIPPFAVA